MTKEFKQAIKKMFFIHNHDSSFPVEKVVCEGYDDGHWSLEEIKYLRKHLKGLIESVEKYQNASL